MMDTPNIILTIKDEHKYTLMLLSVLREQLAEFDIGKTPDYNLMLEIMSYMSNFPEKFNHPIKAKLITAVINKDPANNEELETILAEKKQIKDRAKEVKATLKSLLKDETILKEEQLKIFCKNYVELIEAHIETESLILFPRVREQLSEEELHQFDVNLRDEEDHPFASIMEDRYKEAYRALSRKMDDWEEAANDFAMKEFVGMSALFESIEPFTVGMTEMSKLIKDYSYKMFMANYECYKDLLTTKQESPADYIEKPKECMLTCYKQYIEGLHKLNDVFDDAKKHVLEPYKERKEFLFSKNKSKDNNDQDANVA